MQRRKEECRLEQDKYQAVLEAVDSRQVGHTVAGPLGSSHARMALTRPAATAGRHCFEDLVARAAQVAQLAPCPEVLAVLPEQIVRDSHAGAHLA